MTTPQSRERSEIDPAESTSARVLRWWLALVAGLWLPMSLTYPFGWDQGIFAWVGGVIVRGGVPYRDAWDIKGPVTHFGFALAQWLFGIHLWGIRVLDAALLSLATVSVARVTSRLTDRSTGRWTALVFFLWYASQSYWHTAQPDGWVGMILALAMLPSIGGSTPAGLPALVLIGACVGLTALVKPIYLAFLLLPFVHVWAARVRRPFLSGAAIVGGCVLPIAICLGWFWRHGALDDFVEIYLRYSASVYAGVGSLAIVDRARGLLAYLFEARVVAAGLPIVVVGAVVLWRARPAAAMVLVCWVFIVAGAVGLQNRFFGYHWLPLLPPAAVLGAVGLNSVFQRARLLAQVTFAVVLLACVAPILAEEGRFAAWIAGRIDSTRYYNGYGEPGPAMQTVRWLEQRGQPGKIFIFGWDISVGWLSGRTIVSRFGYSLPLVTKDSLDFRSRYRDEAMRALNADPPRYIIVGTQSEQILREKVSLDDFPELAAYLTANYGKVAQFGLIEIHERTASVIGLKGPGTE